MTSLLPRGRAIAVLAVATSLGLTAGLVAALADDPSGGGDTPAPTSTTRTQTSSSIIPGPSTSTTAGGPTSTTAPGNQPGQPGGGEGDGGNGGADVPAGDGDGASTAPRIVPPEFQKMINSVKRTKANNTGKLLEALRPLVDLGMSEPEAAVLGFGRFPVAGYATFVDDWWFPRFVPTFHLHEGTDIFAPMGTPVRSPVEGVVRRVDGPVGGLAVYVKQKDGTDFYMAHLAGFAEPVDGQTVKVGDVVGYVGDSGNAKGGAPHVHFEIHPKGKAAVNPKPFLDLWITEAIAAAPGLVSSFEAGRPRAVVATGLTRQLGVARSGFEGPAAPPRPQLLWASSASPSGGALRLAEAEAVEAARGVDWARHTARYEREALAWARAERRAKAILSPLTPPALRSVLAYDR